MTATTAIATRSPRRQPKRPFDVPADAALAERHSPRQLEPLTPRTLVDHVVEAIVQAAATGIFMPGDRIVEADVARRLNVSRVPVREALRLLESQGIVVSMPYRGMRLMEVSADRLRKILEVRLALETMAAFMLRAACRDNPQVLAPLEAISAQLHAAALAGDRFGIATLDTRFHRTMCRLTGNEILLAAWEPLACQLTIIFGLSTLQNDMAAIAEEHVVLTDLIRGDDEAALKRNLQLHILDSPQAIDFAALVARRNAPPKKPQRRRA
jgi:DNA-binding GntR family transcriptional regulator